MLKNSLIYLALCMSALTASAENHIYFHWATYESNKEVLQAAHYQFGSQGHDMGLSTTQPGVLNSAVLKKTFDWFFSSGQGDISGPGLYVSLFPHDSITFGPDLLIAEIVNPPKDFLPSYNFTHVGYQYKDFYKDGLLPDAPYIIKYSNTWHVISRLPKQNEPQILLRPPNAGDVERWKNQTLAQLDTLLEVAKASLTNMPGNIALGDFRAFATKEEIFLNQVNSIARISNRDPDVQMITKASRSAEIFADRIVYDVGYRYFVETAMPALAHLRTTTGTSNEVAGLLIEIQNLAGNFIKKIPNDDRTRYLTQYFIQQIKNVDYLTLALLPNKVWIQSLELMSGASEADRAQFFKNVFNAISNSSDDKAENLVSSLLEVRKNPRFLPHESRAVDTFIHDYLVRTRTLNPLPSEYFADFYAVLSKTSDGRNWLSAYITKALFSGGPKANFFPDGRVFTQKVSCSRSSSPWLTVI